MFKVPFRLKKLCKMELIVGRRSQKERQEERACNYGWKEGRNVDSKVGKKKIEV